LSSYISSKEELDVIALPTNLRQYTFAIMLNHMFSQM
jgi:hypothetical protein